MLSEVFKYSGSHAKVKAMFGKLLKNEDYKALLSKSSVNDVASYLKSNTHYKKELQNISESNIHRGELEVLLQDAKDKEFVKLFSYEKSNSTKFLQVFILRYEIELLKEMLRMLESDVLFTFIDKTNDYYKKNMTIDINKLVHSKSISQFIDNLKGSPYFDILSPFTTSQEHLNIFSIEMTLDLYYFNHTWKLKDELLGRKDKKLVENTFGTEVDLLNIMWIIRCKKYFNTPKEVIYSFILPNNFKLKHEQLVALVEAKNVEDILELLKRTPYKNVFKEGDIFIEQYYYKFNLDISRNLTRSTPFSIMTILSYIHAKEIEVNNLIKIIEGIRYKLDMSEIERYLIRSGGDNDVD